MAGKHASVARDCDPAEAWSRGASAVIPDRVLDLEVLARPDQVPEVRHAVVDHLHRHGVASVIIEDIELVTSELVTNAIIHPRGSGPMSRVHLRVVVDDNVVVTVGNRGSAAVIPPVEEWSPAPPPAVSGRGLGIVRRLSDAVAVEQRGDQAVVSCRRHLPDGGGAP